MHRSEIVSMFSVVWNQFIQNLTRIVQYVRKKIIVHVSSELGQHKIVRCIQAEPDSTSYSCFETLLVGRARSCQQRVGTA